MIARSRAGRLARLAFLLVVLSSPFAYAQPDPAVKAYVIDTSRVESWSFFEPHDSTLQPDYTIFGNRATFGVRVTGRRFDLDGAFQYAQLIRLPARAIGPGALGSGGFYYFSAEAPEAYQLYFKTMTARMKDVVPGLSIAVGRMGYASGEETPAGHDELERLKRERLGARFVGDFEWSIFQRSFDGIRADLERPAWSLTTAMLFPTQGGYEESANPTISSVRVLTAAVASRSRLFPHQQVQLFAYHYRDRRDVRGRPDNSGALAPRADVDVTTLGASHVGAFKTRGGEVDAVMWAAVQRGRWYSQSHRAFSAAIEGGYRWRTRGRPWVRAGYHHASGDGNAGDTRHETFFPMLPSINRIAQSATYAPMNLRDAFVQIGLDPHARVHARADVHRLALARPSDRWYHGSGATSRTGDFFGFSGRTSSGETHLGTMTEGAVDISLRPAWSMRAYLGWMRGGGVVRRLFRGDRLLFFSFENVLVF